MWEHSLSFWGELDSDTKQESIINQRKNMLFQITVMSVICIYMINDCYSINCPNRTVQMGISL